MSLDKKLLTAYALGEARGADEERAKVMVERDPEAKKFVDELRAFSSAATADLAREPLPGERGSAPIKAEIERRTKLKSQAPASRGLWREAAVMAVVLIAVGVVGHKKILRYAGMDSPADNNPDVPTVERPVVDVQTESFFGSNGIQVQPRSLKKLPPEKHAEVFNELASLDGRSAAESSLGRCRFQIPEASASDTSSEEGTQLFREFKGASGLLIQVMAAEFPKASFHVAQGEEVTKGGGYKLMKQTLDEGPSAFYHVTSSASEPVCGVKVLLPQVDFTQADTGEVREAANNFAKKLAGTIEVK